MIEQTGKLPRGAKCKRCRRQAEVPLPSHHANFCPSCFRLFCERAVLRAMKRFPLPGKTPLLVAVSGGKDSLALWALLHDLGYTTKGVHVDLGIADFSEPSAAAISRFATPRQLDWVKYSLKDIIGYTIPEIQKRTKRKICSVCGRLKRQLLNRLCVREGYTALVTGHNLDDEAGRLLGNIVRHRTEYLEKLYPYLPSSHPRFPAKLKPLYRLEAKELRFYCQLQQIEPVEGRCPLSRGATSHTFKEALDFLEKRMPGTKRDFLFCYLADKKAPVHDITLNTCQRCGEPSFGELCSVCHLLEQIGPNPNDEEA